MVSRWVVMAQMVSLVSPLAGTVVAMVGWAACTQVIDFLEVFGIEVVGVGLQGKLLC